MDKRRLVTGVVLGLFSLWAIFGFSPLWFTLVVGLFMLLGSWEWAGLIGWRHPVLKSFYVLLMVLVFLLSLRVTLTVLMVAAVFWVIAFLLLSAPLAKTAWLKQPWVLFWVGFLLIVPAWLSARLLQMYDHWQLFYVFMIVTLSDTGAYYAGRAWGKHLLAPSLSPKKTVEGLVGGLLIASIAGVIISFFVPVFATLDQRLFLVGVGFWIILAGMLGDLFESLIKRHTQVKDSGSLLPGHGGVLDRLDSLCAALPLYLLLSVAMGWL